MLPRLSFPAHVGHVVARLANGAGEDGRAIALDMLVEPDAGASLGQHVRKRGPADLQRIAPQVVAIQLDQVESV
jgi:hypothetical protein